MSEDFNSTDDFRYAMRELHGNAEFGEALRSFAALGVGGDVPAPMLELVASNDIITPQDIEAVIGAVLARAGGYSTDPEMQQFIAEAKQNIGGSRASLAGLQSLGMNLANIANANRLDANSPETTAQKIARLFAEIDEIADRMKRDSAALDAYKTPNEIRAEREAEEAVRNTEPGTPARLEAESNLAEVRATNAENVGERNPGNPQIQETVTNITNDNTNLQGKADEARETFMAAAPSQEVAGRAEGSYTRAFSAPAENVTERAGVAPAAAEEPLDFFSAAPAATVTTAAASPTTQPPIAAVPADAAALPTDIQQQALAVSVAPMEVVHTETQPTSPTLVTPAGAVPTIANGVHFG